MINNPFLVPPDLLFDGVELDAKVSFAQLLAYSLTHSLTHSLIYLLTHSLTYSLTHSLPHSLTQASIMFGSRPKVRENAREKALKPKFIKTPYLTPIINDAAVVRYSLPLTSPCRTY